MPFLRTILAATDLSAPARHAAERAARIARTIGARLTLMHGVSERSLHDLRELVGAKSRSVERHLKDRARSELQQLAADLARRHTIDPSEHLVDGAVIAEIANHLEQSGADLLVIGARGEGFMRHLLLGSNAERLLRKTLQPILVVKRIAATDYRRILVALDFSPWSVESIALARAVAPHAELVLVHAFNVPFEGSRRLAGMEEHVLAQYRNEARQRSFERMLQFASETGIDPVVTWECVLHGDPARRIVEQEQVQDCDLIVIGKHGRNALEELLLGSVTRRVLSESSCDILVSSTSRA